MDVASRAAAMPAGKAAPIQASSFLIVLGLSDPYIMPTKNPPSTLSPYESQVVSTPALNTVTMARNAAQKTVCREHKRATGKPLRRGAKRGKEHERSSEIQREARHRPAHGRAQRQGRECAGGRSDEGQPDGSDYLGSAVDEVWLVERRRLGDLLVIKEDVEVVHPCCRIFDAHPSLRRPRQSAAVLQRILQER